MIATLAYTTTWKSQDLSLERHLDLFQRNSQNLPLGSHWVERCYSTCLVLKTQEAKVWEGACLLQGVSSQLLREWLVFFIHRWGVTSVTPGWAEVMFKLISNWSLLGTDHSEQMHLAVLDREGWPFHGWLRGSRTKRGGGFSKKGRSQQWRKFGSLGSGCLLTGTRNISILTNLRYGHAAACLRNLCLGCRTRRRGSGACLSSIP